MTNALPQPKSTDVDLWTKNATIVFLVGCPRSGTTWLQNMLAMHPSIATGPETHFFSKARMFEGKLEESPPRPAGILQYISAEEFYAALVEFFHRIISKVPEPDGCHLIFLEKSPQHALFLPLIAKCLPHCRIIHLIRDGRHVVASLLRASRTWGKGKFPSNPSSAAELWKKSIVEARKAPELFDRADAYYELRYEDLRKAPRESLQQIFDWLDLRTEDGDIESIIAASSLSEAKSRMGFNAISIPSQGNVVAAAEPNGFFGMASVGNKSFDLTRREEYACYQASGALLKELGYCESIPSIPRWARLANSWRLRRLLDFTSSPPVNRGRS